MVPAREHAHTVYYAVSRHFALYFARGEQGPSYHAEEDLREGGSDSAVGGNPSFGYLPYQFQYKLIKVFFSPAEGFTVTSFSFIGGLLF